MFSSFQNFSPKSHQHIHRDSSSYSVAVCTKPAQIARSNRSEISSLLASERSFEFYMTQNASTKMKFDVDYPDFKHPNETKAAFKQRFLSSLPATFQEFTPGREFAVLHLRSGFRRTIWECLAFWRPLKLHNFPVKAHWAAEALAEHGYDWKLRWYRYAYSNAKHPAIWVKLSDSYFDGEEVPPKSAYAGNAQLALRPAKQKVTGRTYPKLVWNRDANK